MEEETKEKDTEIARYVGIWALELQFYFVFLLGFGFMLGFGTSILEQSSVRTMSLISNIVSPVGWRGTLRSWMRS